MMRIAYVCADPGVPVFGRKGATVHVQEMLRAFERLGAQVELFATRIGGDPPPDLAHVPLHALPPVGKADPAERERRALRANRGLRAALEQGPARGGRFDMVYERYSMHSHAGMTWARARGLPGVLEVNAPLIDEHALHRGLANRWMAEAVAAKAFTAAGTVVAVSDAVARWVRARSIRPDAVHVLPNGVDLTRFKPTPRPVGPTFTVGFVGTLKPWHGVRILVEAVAALASGDRSWRLLIVGDGPERGALEVAAASAGVDAIAEFTGAVDPACVPGLLARMDVATAPYPAADSHYFSPLKLYEYLAAGLPVVAGAVGQVAEVLSDGVTGVLVPPGDGAALAAALRGLRVAPARRAALGAAGRAAAEAHHGWDAVACRILTLAGVTERAGAA